MWTSSRTNEIRSSSSLANEKRTYFEFSKHRGLFIIIALSVLEKDGSFEMSLAERVPVGTTKEFDQMTSRGLFYFVKCNDPKANIVSSPYKSVQPSHPNYDKNVIEYNRKYLELM